MCRGVRLWRARIGTGVTSLASIVQLLSEVSKEVGAVRKDQRNTQQGFSFRGIDQVVNSTHTALTARGIVAIPNVHEVAYDEYSTSRGNRQAWVKVLVDYTFHGPDGDSVTARVAAEAGDSADKGTSKAMSVAYRTALLQVLHLPTDDPDPDSEYVERGAPAVRKPRGEAPEPVTKPASTDPVVVLRGEVIELLKAKQIPPNDARAQLEWLGGSGAVSECVDVDRLQQLKDWAAAK